jgi:hypothetical protein
MKFHENTVHNEAILFGSLATRSTVVTLRMLLTRCICKRIGQLSSNSW